MTFPKDFTLGYDNSNKDNTLPRKFLYPFFSSHELGDMVDHGMYVWSNITFSIAMKNATKGEKEVYPSFSL